MKAVIDYCLQQKKVTDEDSDRRLVGGVNCNGENAFTEFMVTKNTYKKTGDVTFYQYVQSFSPRENVTAEHLHNQFVINSALRSLAGITDGSEDPEERRKKIEAEENASNLGAVIGLVVGAIAAISDADTAEETETPTLKM